MARINSLLKGFVLAGAMLVTACTSADHTNLVPNRRAQTNLHQVKKSIPEKNILVISLLPPTYDGEFIAERSITSLTKHKEQVLYTGSMSDYNFKLDKAPSDVELVRMTNNISPQNCMDAIVRALDQHIKKCGQPHILEIIGHGRTNTTAIGENSPLSPTIDNREMLQTLLLYKKASGHIRLADTILLGGCNVMSDLSPEDTRLYDKLAKQLNCKIEGSTVTVDARRYNDNGVSGLFAIFDGSKSVAVDTALSQMPFYLNEAVGHGCEDQNTIKTESTWIPRYNRHIKAQGVVSQAVLNDYIDGKGFNTRPQQAKKRKNHISKNI